jgi:hypothetical protein
MIATSHVPSDCDIEGLVRQDDACDIGPHKPFGDGGIGSISADQAMRAKQE